MRVLRAGEDAELGQHLGGDAVLRQHAFDGVLDDELGVTLALLGELAVAFAADEAGEEHVLVLHFLLAGQRDLLGIDDDDEVAIVHGGGVGSLMTTTDDVGSFDGETTEHDTFSIDQMPLGLHCLILGEERFHEKRGQKVRFHEALSTPVLGCE